MMRAAQAHFLDGADDRCASLLEQVVELVDAEADPLRAAEVLGELARVRWSLGHGERSRETLDRAFELVADDATAQRAVLLAHRMRFRFLQGRYGDVVEIGLRAIELAEGAGMLETRATAMNRVGFSLFPLGEPERGERTILDGIELVRSEGPRRRPRHRLRQLRRPAPHRRPLRRCGSRSSTRSPPSSSSATGARSGSA